MSGAFLTALRFHAAAHPALGAEDADKLCYQAAFGRRISYRTARPRGARSVRSLRARRRRTPLPLSPFRTDTPAAASPHGSGWACPGTGC